MRCYRQILSSLPLADNIADISSRVLTPQSHRAIFAAFSNVDGIIIPSLTSDPLPRFLFLRRRSLLIRLDSFFGIALGHSSNSQKVPSPVFIAAKNILSSFPTCAAATRSTTCLLVPILVLQCLVDVAHSDRPMSAAGRCGPILFSSPSSVFLLSKSIPDPPFFSQM